MGPNEVRIKNEYISIQGGDLIAREVMPPERVPHIVGYQCAGEIVEIGAQVRKPDIATWTGRITKSAGAEGRQSLQDSEKCNVNAST